MLSSLANFFFGSFTSDNSDISNSCDNSDNLGETFVKGSDGEDWILINRKEKLANHSQSSSKSHHQNLNQEKNEKNEKNEKSQMIGNVSVTQSIHETQQGNNNNNGMDESWFITPPPCFTKKFQVASSPIENILIEHPSTSVFHRHFSLFGFLKDSTSNASTTFSAKQFDSKLNEKKGKKDGARGRNPNRKQQKSGKREAQKKEAIEASSASSKNTKGNENGKNEKVNKNTLESDSNLKQRHTQKQIPLVETTNFLASMQKVSEKKSQKHLSKTFMNRQNLVMYKGNLRPTRRKKLTLIQNGYSFNRKSC